MPEGQKKRKHVKESEVGLCGDHHGKLKKGRNSTALRGNHGDPTEQRKRNDLNWKLCQDGTELLLVCFEITDLKIVLQCSLFQAVVG